MSNVHEPMHYAGNGLTCKEAERSMVHGVELEPQLAHWWLSAFEYLWRWPLKNGAEDLRKCRELLGYMIEEAEKEGK